MPEVEIEVKEKVCTIILNRPQLKNAVNKSVANQLAEAFRDFEKNNDQYVAVLWGKGGTFCAGADLNEVARLTKENRIDLEPDMSLDGPMGPTRMFLAKPVIAAVSGYAVAGGLELALWCDLRVVERNAVFGVFCRRFGVPLVDGGTQRLPRLVGMSNALDMILTGRPVEAEEALRMGLANRVVEPGTAKSEAENLAKQIAAFPQVCLRSDREAVYRGFDQEINSALELEFKLGMKVVASGETERGARRFKKGFGKHGEFFGIPR